MTQTPYNKPAITFDEQLELLINRGLIVQNKEKALHLLRNISYYRFSAYWYPFISTIQTNQFKDGATFEQAFKLYCFDRELRKLISNELEKLEVSFRTQIIYTLSHNFGPYWFEDKNLFVDEDSYVKTISKLTEEYKRTSEEFITNFRNKYQNPFPPSWILLEIASFGTLSKLYKNFKRGRTKNEVANFYGLSDDVFASWLHSLVYLRNICAHHGRLWNIKLQIKTKKIKTKPDGWLINSDVKVNKIFYLLSVILYLLKTVNPQNNFLVKLLNLLDQNQFIDKSEMGFAMDWEKENLWVRE